MYLEYSLNIQNYLQKWLHQTGTPFLLRCSQMQSAEAYQVNGSRTHPHFADRMAQAFTDARLTQRNAVELASVQVDHWALARLLPNRAARFYTVLKHVPTTQEMNSVTSCFQSQERYNSLFLSSRRSMF